MRRLAILALGLVALAPPALAATASVSYSTWTISPDKIILKFVLPVAEAQRLTGTKMPLVTVTKLEAYLLKHTGVTSGGENCPAADQGYDLGRVDPLSVGPGFYGYEIFFKCPDRSQTFVFENHVLFDRAPEHVDFARISTASGHVVSQVFTARRQELRVPATGAAPAARTGQYLYLGYLHIRSSLDRLFLLLGLLLLMRRKEDMAYVGLGLVAGYVLSIGESAVAWMTPRGTLLEAFVGFLVALIAAEIAARESGRDKIAAAGGLGLAVLAVVAAFTYGAGAALVLLGAALVTGGFLIASRHFAAWSSYSLGGIAVIFGYLDGFVLPAQLAPVNLPRRAIVWMSTAFDLGAVLTCAAFLLLAGGALVLLRRRKTLLLPSGVVHDLLAAGLGGLGVFWLLTRL